MLKFRLTAILVLATSVSFAQNGVTLKLYQNTDFFKVTNYYSQTQQSTLSEKVNFNRFSVAGTLQGKKSLVHELELFIPEVSKPIDQASFPMNYDLYTPIANTKETITSFSFRYEVSKVLHQSKKLAFSLGIGINPYYTKAESMPLTALTFYRYLKKYGASINFIPRIVYTITSKIRMELNIPLKVYDLREEKQKIENPAIPIGQQTNGGLVSVFFENVYTIRLGIAYKL